MNAHDTTTDEPTTELTTTEELAALEPGDDVVVRYSSANAPVGNEQTLVATVADVSATEAAKADYYGWVTVSLLRDDDEIPRRRLEGQPGGGLRVEYRRTTPGGAAWERLSRGATVSVERVDTADESDETASLLSTLAAGDDVVVTYESAYADRGNEQVVEATVADVDDRLPNLADKSIFEVRLVTEDRDDHESAYEQADADRRLVVAVVEGETVFAEYEGRNGGRWHGLHRAGTDATVTAARVDDESAGDTDSLNGGEPMTDGGRDVDEQAADDDESAGGDSPAFSVGERATDRDDDESGPMRVVDPDVGRADEVEVGTTGSTVAEFVGNEAYPDDDRVVTVAFSTDLDADVDGWRDRDEPLDDYLDAYADEWGVRPQTYSYPESRLDHRQGDEQAGESDGELPDELADERDKTAESLERLHDDLREGSVETLDAPDLPTAEERDDEPHTDGGAMPLPDVGHVVDVTVGFPGFLEYTRADGEVYHLVRDHLERIVEAEREVIA